MRVRRLVLLLGFAGASCKFAELPPLGGDGGPDIDAAVSCTTSGADPACPATSPVCVQGVCSGPCISDDDCAARPAEEQVCHRSSGACAECDEDDRQAEPGTPEDDCPGSNAVCDGDSHTCRSCAAHDECFSGVCDAGFCVPSAAVIYMSADGSDGSSACNDRANGCLTLDFAINQLTAIRSYILMEPSATPYATRSTMDRADFSATNAHVIGYGATLNRLGPGMVVEVGEGADVTVEGLTISNGSGTAGSGVVVYDGTLRLLSATVKDNRARGVDAQAGSRLVIHRSMILNNEGGGIYSDSGEFDIVNSVIARNGDLQSSNFGGVSLVSGAATNAFEFNTIVDNVATTGNADQISCFSADLDVRNNIISGRTPGRQRVAGNCMHTFSLFSPDGAPTGTGNMTILDPAAFMFASDYHIGTGSVAAGKAQSTNLAEETLFDLDGQPRILNGTTVDVGADEIP